MDQFDATVGLAGALAVSVAAYAALRGIPSSDRLRSGRSRSRLDDLTADMPRLIDPEPDSHALPDAVRPPVVLAPAVRARRVTPAGRARNPRPGVGRLAGPEPGAADLISLIGTMQWDRALALVERLAATGQELGPVAAMAEAAALERVRALPETDLCLGFGAYRVLAALAPANPIYAERVAQGRAALEERRAALMAGLTRDEDRFDPGTTWLNHPWNPRFDDIRRPVWLYIGCKADGRPWLRLRTNWLGDCRICVRGLEVVHDGMSETLTRGAYKIDADALGWEWRDEPADMYQIEVLRSLTSAGEVTLRYKGDPWPCDAPFPEEEKRALGEMIELYDLMTLAAHAPREAQAA